MEDSISRQAAIDVVRDVMLDFIEYEDEIEVPMADTDKQLLSIKKAISKRTKALPSAQPGRKTGKWEIYAISMLDGNGCRCSECGFEGVPYWYYCPGCGARMEVEWLIGEAKKQQQNSLNT